ncbi:enoyl-CoA delta isomerase 1, mitochondrial-like [Chironomus tepperi]|uniref:enoyl-CoA delta isomerase 1, mitochondrial-like n=1 Tax=Chironomus tepperi TaxID=113505 RepID=UPI00391FAA8D
MALNSIKISRIFNQNAFRCIALSAQRNQSTAAKKEQLIITDVNKKTGFATLSFNRPSALNSFTLELLQDFSKALDEVEEKKYKGMILTSTSTNAFTAGLDIKELINPDPARLRELRAVYLDCCLKLYNSLFPTAAAINGHAIGGGCFLAIACEYRVMLPNFKIGLNETQLGIAVPEVAILATKNVISSRDSEMALTLGTVFSSEKALEIGLVDEIAKDQAEAIAKCEAFMLKFKSVPALARGITKQLFRKKIVDLMSGNKEKDVENFVSYVLDPASQQSLKAFLDRSKK